MYSGVTGYDTFSEILVAAPDEETARDLNPYGESYKNGSEEWDLVPLDWGRMWASDPSLVRVVEIGTTPKTKVEVLMTSFHAGQSMTIEEFWTADQINAFRIVGMTDQELEAFMYVSLAANKVLALPALHRMHREENCHDFHHIQNRILARPGIRAIAGKD